MKIWISSDYVLENVSIKLCTYIVVLLIAASIGLCRSTYAQSPDNYRIWELEQRVEELEAELDNRPVSNWEYRFSNETDIFIEQRNDCLRDREIGKKPTPYCEAFLSKEDRHDCWERMTPRESVFCSYWTNILTIPNPRRMRREALCKERFPTSMEEMTEEQAYEQLDKRDVCLKSEANGSSVIE